MEVAIRFNDDYENDYVCEINKKHTVKNYLHPMFSPYSKLADVLAFRPSIFYDKVPTKFYKSVGPGTLTSGGTVLFNFDSSRSKNLVELDEDKPLVEQLWPGQLIVPQWRVNPVNLLKYITVVSLWLYTDLPDFISPTPGNCLTNYISRLFMIPLLKLLDLPEYVEKLEKEIAPNSVGKTAQIVFFSLHLIKILIMSLFFILGMANPISFNPWKIKQANSITVNDPCLKDNLKSIGWLGIKKSSYDVYKKEYYDAIMKKHGGMVGAYKAGVIKRAANPGIKLSEGEGYATPITNRHQPTFEIMENEGRFILSDEYFKELQKEMDQLLSQCGDNYNEINNLIKNFRRYGLLEPGPKVNKLITKKENVYGKFALAEQFDALEESKKKK
ncbi:uncharacterized protein KNAG_0E04250 [Huiozyma naganishii CBS 8797]|uniref:Uncharacterized protein n=1 Tax=Huiozyma naganishii (strain ATCC MYA-139 / BCRC 22969 / CBS 8797 / KCTC 17520 / NBRC 10181 / NCYC 3082 / Yp74L-3) TaxID=1071383 RepID=J7RMA7_HUIN7|nr:hypothetical protein KNAG_0E04250 [Kazachstania naganishii CBS 8797]CCK70678.1 hypothetical protein KNAG_0E04250 [Kazachstania naganishii CBS 8797]